MKTVTLYTTEPCSHCSSAKAFLRRRGIAFQEVNLSKDAAGRAELVERTGMMTFPQILVADEPLGGLQELLHAERSGRLHHLLAA